MGYESNNNIVFSCKYHVVWFPKYRRKVLYGAVEDTTKLPTLWTNSYFVSTVGGAL